MNANSYTIIIYILFLKWSQISVYKFCPKLEMVTIQIATTLKQDISSWSEYLPTDFPENHFYFTTPEAMEHCYKMRGNATTCES